MKRIVKNIREETEDVSSEKQETSSKTYAELYNKIVTEITRLPHLFSRIRYVYRLFEAGQRNIQNLEDIYNELENTLENIDITLSQLRQKEGEVLFVAGHVDPQTVVENYMEFANFYKLRRGEAYESITESKTNLNQIKNEIINKIPEVLTRNKNLRKWNEYYNKVVKFENELKHINDVVIVNANEVDKKFNTIMVKSF
jgi:DNA repair exonuclease SbcCD ATPase subunit